ncbi:hypothetical protein GP486_004407 [Trichoglossum hirsutum]|uniref:CTLH domain-containing protein n=1 Tax=Trichoglossum hirsutum TaxID=265104 RepID=A0A9P8LB80_9PEZI|nr:hypothetical protein GP486_004407 [Trichoglossum hirsutum]
MRHSFERRVDDIRISKADINAVILDYLINEGYPSAAKKFAAEANIQPAVDIQSIQERVEIRSAIHRGDIQTAIENINELNPQTSVLSMSKPGIFFLVTSTLDILALIIVPLKILDSNPTLHFALLRLQLVELIRECTSVPNGDITPALNFATTQLAPRAPTNPEFLEDLERTMALLIFPPDNLVPPLASLLDPSLRQIVANKVNEAILVSQGARKEPKMRDLVRLRAWAEQKAREAKKDLPLALELGLDLDDHPTSSGVTQGNGDAESMMT